MTVHRLPPMPAPAMVIMGNKLFSESQMMDYAVQHAKLEVDKRARAAGDPPVWSNGEATEHTTR